MNPESIIRWLGGSLAYGILALLFYGIWRGTKRQTGRISGLSGRWLGSAWFYLVTSVIFFGLSYVGWKPLPWLIPAHVRVWMLVVGSLLYFPGAGLLLWGRLALGKNYFVSTGLGAQLFEGQKLVTSGPYAWVRHPMYVGLILSALGSLLIYMTWTTLIFACCAPLILVRAYREESVLSAEFGVQWQEYCRHVPAFLPRLRKES